MADEIKKVITIDTAESITSLKEYKKHIDDLRGALLALDEDSQEYADIVKEIQDEQNKLNTVMKAGKESTEAADGSYNQLCQTMKELKAQWRATADEAERAELGQQILDINNKLKELDASTGNFQRNVGDYQNAFEQAFNTISQSIGGVGGDLSKVMGTTKQMIPLIKACTKTATAGLSGIKKALVSTGIGALIVALGTILAYWEDISEWIKKATGFVDTHAQAIQALEGYVESLKQKHKELKEILDYENDLYAAAGATREQQLQRDLDNQKALIDDAFAEEMRLYNAWSLNKDNVDRKLVEAQKKAADDAAQYRRDLEVEWNKAAAQLNVERQRLITENLNMVAEFDQSVQEQADILTQHFNEALASAGTAAWTQVKAFKDYLDGLNELINANKQTNEEEKELQKEQQRRAEEKRRQYEQERQAALNLAETIRQASLTELEALDEKYANEKAQLERFGLDTTLLTEQYEEKRLQIIQSKEDEIAQAYRDAEEARHQAILASYENEAEQAEFEIDYSTEVMTEQQIADAKYQIERDLMDRKIALQQEYLVTYDEFLQQQLEDNVNISTEEWQAQQAQREEIEAQLQAYLQQSANLEKARIKEVADFEKEQAEAVKKYKQATYLASLNAAGSMFGSLADMMEEGSEEAKALSIMETTINTISGAIGAFLQASSSYPAPYGQIIGGVTAAAVTAAGIAEIAKIKSTKLGSTTNPTAPDTSTPDVGAIVSPLLDEQQDINGMTTLPETPNSQQGGGDKRVYVVESDIAEAGQKVEVREHEATF